MDINLDKLINYLKMHPMLSPKFCSNCGHAHGNHDLSVVNMKQGEIIFQLSCSSCGLVQVIRLSPNGPMTIQRFESNNSDIVGPEFAKFAGKPSVHKDEALEVYSSLQGVRSLNDFLQLVEKASTDEEKSIS